MAKLPFKPTPAQMPMLLSPAKYKLGGGGVGGGKTTFIAGGLVDYAVSHPDTLAYIGRLDLEDLKKTTLVELLRMIPKGLGVGDNNGHNKSEKKITIHSVNPAYPSVIYYGELKDPNSILSLNLNIAAIDEAFEVPKESFQNLATRLRRNAPDGSDQDRYLLLASNPFPCWIMDYFPVTERDQRLVAEGKWQRPMFRYFEYLAKDNPYLPPGYVESLEEMYADDPVSYARYVLGRWDTNMEGLVYQLQPEHRWNPTIGREGARLYRHQLPVQIGVDPSNGAGVYAAVVIQQWGNRLHVVDEFYMKGGTDEDFCDWVQSRPWKNKIGDMVSDNAKKDTITRLRRLGFPARGCGRKDVTAQINAVKAHMRINPDTNQANLLIDEAMCRNLIHEMGNRSYRKPKSSDNETRRSEQPVKKWDHICNALEYLILDKYPVGDSVDTSVYRAPAKHTPAYMRAYR